MAKKTIIIETKFEGAESISKGVEEIRNDIIELLKQRKALEDEMSDMELSGDAFDILSGNLKQIESDAISLINALELSGEDVSEYSKLLQQAGIENEDAFDVSGIAAMNAELSHTNEILSRLPSGTKEFDNLNKRATELEGNIQGATKSVDEHKDSYISLGTSVAAGFAGVAGILNTIGAGGKDAEKAILSIQQIMLGMETARKLAEAASILRRKFSLSIQKEELSATQKQIELEKKKREQQSAGGEAKPARTLRERAADVGGGIKQKVQAAKERVSGAVSEIKSDPFGALQKSGSGLVGLFKNLLGGVRAFIGGLRAAAAAVVSNPLGLLALAVAGLALAFVNFSKRVPVLGKAMTEIKKVIGTVSGVIYRMNRAIEDTISQFDSLGDAVDAFGETALGVFKDVGNGFANMFKGDFSFSDITNRVKKAYQEVSNVIKQENVRAGRLLQLAQDKELLQVARHAQEVQNAKLGNTKATEATVRANEIRLLRMETDIANEQLKLKHHLTDEEIKIIKSGNLEKIKQLKNIAHLQGAVNDEAIEDYKEVAEKENTTNTKLEAARIEAIDARRQQLQDELDVTQTQLANVANFANQKKSLEAASAKELKDLQLQNQRGDFRTQGEYDKKVVAAKQRSVNELEQLARDYDTHLVDIANTGRESQVQSLENTRGQLELISGLTFDFESKNAAKQYELRKQSIEAQISILDTRRSQDFAAEKKLQADLVKISEEYSIQRIRIVQTSVERELGIRERITKLLQSEIELERRRGDTNSKQVVAALEEQAEALERQKELIITSSDVADAYAAEVALITKEYENQYAVLERNFKLTNESLAEQERLLLRNRDGILKLYNESAIGLEEFSRRINEVNSELASVRQDSADNKIEFEISVKALNREEIADRARKAADATVAEYEAGTKGLGNAIEKNISEGFSNALEGKFFEEFKKTMSEEDAAEAAKQAADAAGKAFAEKFMENVGKLGGAVTDLVNTLFERQAAAFDRQAERFELYAQNAQTKIDKLKSSSQESAQTILGIEQELATARGKAADILTAQLNAETELRARLQQNLKKQEVQKAKFERAKINAQMKSFEIQRQQAIFGKLVGITQATINTAQAVTGAMAALPGPPGLVMAAIVGALGAIQIATIAATPLPPKPVIASATELAQQARDGGFISPTGQLLKAEKGGILQGPKHEEGGVPGFGRLGGIEAEGGEAIIPAASVLRNRAVVDALISEGPARTVAVRQFRHGGILAADGGLISSLNNIQQLRVAPVVTNNTQQQTQPVTVIVPEQRPTEVKVSLSMSDISAGLARYNDVDKGARL